MYYRPNSCTTIHLEETKFLQPTCSGCYDRCMVTGLNCGYSAALGYELTTLKSGSSIGIDPNRHIILCMRARRNPLAAFGCNEH